MEIQPGSLEPTQYSDDRLEAFYTRATSVKNLPKEYIPDDTVPKQLFADAMLGHFDDQLTSDYEKKVATALWKALKKDFGWAKGLLADGRLKLLVIDNTAAFRESFSADDNKDPRLDEKAIEEIVQRASVFLQTYSRNNYDFTYDAGRTQLAFAVEYLEGAPIDELGETLDSFHFGRTVYVDNFALEAAAKGARRAREMMKEPEIEVIKEPLDVNSFANLHNSIIDLREQGRILTDGMAVMLLVLFEQREPTQNTSEVFKNLLLETRRDLMARMKRARHTQPQKKDEFIDVSFGRGLEYIKEIVAPAFIDRKEQPPLRYIIDTRAESDNDKTREQHEAEILAHIGYALNVLY